MSKRIDDIEILRAFAIIFVLFHHAKGNLITWTTPSLERLYRYFGDGGWVGVDLFFAISGFVIARSLLPELTSATSSVERANVTLAFWVRRAWRLWPSAWIWLLVILLSSVLLSEKNIFSNFQSNYEASVAAFTHVANLRFAEGFGNWAIGDSFPYWSLSLEEQFYIALPLLALLAGRHTATVLLIVVGLQIFSERNLFTMQIRTDALCLGALIAIWSNHETYKIISEIKTSRLALGALSACLLICLLSFGSHSLNTITMKASIAAIISSALVFIASQNKNIFPKVPLFKSALIWTGSRSYAIYLCHIPAFFFARAIYDSISKSTGLPPDEGGKLIILVALSSTLIISFSEINYRIIELPLRKKGVSISNKIHQRKNTPQNKNEISESNIPQRHNQVDPPSS